VDVGGAPKASPLLIRDRDQKFSESFDRVFQSDGIEIARTPFRAPQANGVAERFVRTVRTECLDWLLILNGQHLEHVVRVFIDHYNGHRPHRGLALAPPVPVRLPAGEWSDDLCVLRRDRLGGAIHEYNLAA
jgi:transposase InsO family protein